MPTRRGFSLPQVDLINVAELIREGVAEGVDDSMGSLTQVVERFQRNYYQRSKFLEANQSLAEGMRQATLQRYRETVLADKGVPSYRFGENRFPGGLLNALSSPSMAQASASGIGFIDGQLLDSIAKHWWRMNFGAGAAGADPVPPANARWGNQTLGNIQTEGSPSAPFIIPPGYFNKQGQFFPGSARGRRDVATRIRKPRGTKGIRGRRFLEAGISYFARNFRKEYVKRLEEIADEVRRRA